LFVFAPAAVFRMENAAARDTCWRSTDSLVHLQFSEMSVHIGTVLLRKILPGESFHLTSPAHFREKRMGQETSVHVCLVGGIRFGESLIELQDNKRARRDCNTSLGSAPLEQYHQPTVLSVENCLLR